MIEVSGFRVFLTVAPHPAYAVIGLAATTVCGLWMLWLNPRDVDSALAMILFGQMFIASTAFLPEARRGHFDQVIVESANRLRLAATHAVASMVPGACAWIAILAFAAASGNVEVVSAIVGVRALAWLLVSTTAWSIGVFVPRGMAGVGWTVLLMGALLGQDTIRILGLLRPSGANGLGVIESAATLVLCPFLLLGGPVFSVRALCLAAAFVAVLFCLVLLVASRRDIVLEDES